MFPAPTSFPAVEIGSRGEMTGFADWMVCREHQRLAVLCGRRSERRPLGYSVRSTWPPIFVRFSRRVLEGYGGRRGV